MARSFTLGKYRLDVVSHSRVFNPSREENTVAEAFEVDLYDISNPTRPEPFDWYPNTSPHPHPERRQRQTFYWYGKQFQDVYDDLGVLVGSKRGADFRTRFFPSIISRIEKAEAASRVGISVKEVKEEDILKSDLSEPVDMRRMALNIAVESLTGEPARVTTRIPRGTVANIDADFDGYAESDGGSTTGTTITVQRGGGFDEPRRVFIRFPLAVLPTGVTVNDVSLQFNKTSESVEVGEDIEARSYNSIGDDDPQADDSDTQFVSCATGTIRATITGDGTGSISVDLGTAVDAEVEGNIDSPDRWSVGLVGDADWESSETVVIEAIENAGTDPATLIVDYSTAGADGAIAATLLEPIASAMGEQPYEGDIEATITEPLASLIGSQEMFGTIISILQMVLANLEGGMISSGAIVSQLQMSTVVFIGGTANFVGIIRGEITEPTFTASGFMSPNGILIAEITGSTAVLMGVMVPVGTIEAVMQAATSALSGVAGMSGAILSEMQEAIMNANGVMVPEGQLASELQNALFTAAGLNQIIAILSAILEQPTFESTDSQIISLATLAAVLQAAEFVTLEAGFTESRRGDPRYIRPGIMSIKGSR